MLIKDFYLKTRAQIKKIFSTVVPRKGVDPTAFAVPYFLQSVGELGYKNTPIRIRIFEQPPPDQDYRWRWIPRRPIGGPSATPRQTLGSPRRPLDKPLAGPWRVLWDSCRIHFNNFNKKKTLVSKLLSWPYARQIPSLP